MSKASGSQKRRGHEASGSARGALGSQSPPQGQSQPQGQAHPRVKSSPLQGHHPRVTHPRVTHTPHPRHPRVKTPQQDTAGQDTPGSQTPQHPRVKSCPAPQGQVLQCPAPQRARVTPGSSLEGHARVKGHARGSRQGQCHARVKGQASTPGSKHARVKSCNGGHPRGSPQGQGHPRVTGSPRVRVTPPQGQVLQCNISREHPTPGSSLAMQHLA